MEQFNNEQFEEVQTPVVEVVKEATSQGIDAKGVLLGMAIGAATAAVTFVLSKPLKKKIKAKAKAKKDEPIDVEYEEVDDEKESKETEE